MARRSSWRRCGKSAQQTVRNSTCSAQFHMLALLPHALSGIELGGVARQPYQLSRFGPALVEEGVDFPFMDGRAIPDHQQFSASARAELLEEADTISTRQGGSPHHRVACSAHCHAAHHRQMVTREPAMHEGRRSAEGIRARYSRPQIAARFVHPHECQPLPVGLFVRAGQRSCRQAVMRVSSRCAARWRGICGVPCTPGSKRETGALW